MKVRYTVRARADIEEIGAYLVQHNPKIALMVRSALQSSIELLADFPRRGRRQTAEGVRRVGAGKFPYNIYYLADEAVGEIVVLNVRHAARKREYEDV